MMWVESTTVKTGVRFAGAFKYVTQPELTKFWPLVPLKLSCATVIVNESPIVPLFTDDSWNTVPL